MRKPRCKMPRDSASCKSVYKELTAAMRSVKSKWHEMHHHKNPQMSCAGSNLNDGFISGQGGTGRTQHEAGYPRRCCCFCGLLMISSLLSSFCFCFGQTGRPLRHDKMLTLTTIPNARRGDATHSKSSPMGSPAGSVRSIHQTNQQEHEHPETPVMAW